MIEYPVDMLKMISTKLSGVYFLEKQVPVFRAVKMIV